MKKILIVLLTVVFLSAISCTVHRYRRPEVANHPRIENAIKELQRAIDFMEEAPNDFGGYKAQAIADSKKAVASLKLALQYRARQDNIRRK